MKKDCSMINISITCGRICRLYVNYRFMRGIEQQFLALYKGFTEIVPAQLLKPFDERELELIIGGLVSIDIQDWKQNTRLKVSFVGKMMNFRVFDVSVTPYCCLRFAALYP